MIVLQFCADEKDLCVLDYLCKLLNCDYETAFKFALGFYFNNYIKGNKIREEQYRKIFLKWTN